VLHRPVESSEFFTDETMRALLASSLETAAMGPDGFTDVGSGPGSTEADYIDWLTIRDSRQSVIDDVQRIRKHPLVPARITVHGHLYDVRSGRLIDVLGADGPEHAA
jgi:carbonic anhydrase